MKTNDKSNTNTGSNISDKFTVGPADPIRAKMILRMSEFLNYVFYPEAGHIQVSRNL